ncbi:phage tail protein I [Clostridium botulinum]|nr:phage tail protein I [Clostridium botulinum]NFI17331.1 phage tail protein I [Clostridium botulinum]NFL92092.1 phage tail protein I [Clostridium botulinum]NFN52134.1 phage tail protein I [Clostridium botulinum]NFO26653.1 phage tail protein I [Clostridium botulinum]
MELSKINLLSLQTSYLQKDVFVQALCKALNPYFKKLSDSIRLVYIYGRIDELDEEAIDSLAWQFHVDFYDYTLSLDQKRELVKKSKMLHRIKGTPKAVEEAATTVFGKTKLQEWFEYGGKPYFFGLNVDITEVGCTPEELKKLDNLIKAYKNKRSWVDYINLFIASKGNIYVAATTVTSEEIEVLPWCITEINSKINVNIPISICSSEIIEVYPKEE